MASIILSAVPPWMEIWAAGLALILATAAVGKLLQGVFRDLARDIASWIKLHKIAQGEELDWLVDHQEQLEDLLEDRPCRPKQQQQRDDARGG